MECRNNNSAESEESNGREHIPHKQFRQKVEPIRKEHVRKIKKGADVEKDKSHEE